jgi:hypothetical protein
MRFIIKKELPEINRTTPLFLFKADYLFDESDKRESMFFSEDGVSPPEADSISFIVIGESLCALT